MRRNDRAVTDPEAIWTLFQNAYILRIAYVDEDGLTIVPLTYCPLRQDGKILLIFHSALSGRKVEAFLRMPHVAFEIEEEPQFASASLPCENGWFFASIIGHGIVRPIEEAREKASLLTALVARLNPEAAAVKPEQAAACRVFALEVTDCTAKRRVQPKNDE